MGKNKGHKKQKSRAQKGSAFQVPGSDKNQRARELVDKFLKAPSLPTSPSPYSLPDDDLPPNKPWGKQLQIHKVSHDATTSSTTHSTQNKGTAPAADPAEYSDKSKLPSPYTSGLDNQNDTVSYLLMALAKLILPILVTSALGWMAYLTLEYFSLRERTTLLEFRVNSFEQNQSNQAPAISADPQEPLSIRSASPSSPKVPNH